MNMSLAELGRSLNISGSTFKEYRDKGLSERVADRRAVQCGLDPYQVWPQMLEDAIEDAAKAEEERAARQRRLKAVRAKRAYWRNPEKHRAERRKYKEETREAARKYRRRYYQQNREQEIARSAEYRRRKREERRNSEAA